MVPAGAPRRHALHATLPAGDDHSNIFKNVTMGLCPEYPYQFWKDVALSGSENVYYYQSDGGTRGPTSCSARAPP